MKKCPNCNTNYPAEYAHCPNDGALLIEFQEAAAPAPQSTVGNPSQADATILAMQQLLESRKRSRRIIYWVIGGAVLLIIIVIAIVAISSVGPLNKRANETSATQSIRAITQAEIQYASAYPEKGYACSLEDLATAQLLQGGLASGMNSGYLFSIGNCSQVAGRAGSMITDYQITAVPERPGKTGDRGFCSDSSTTIKVDPSGGTNCTEPLE